MKPGVCERLAWDSEFFGLRIARVREASLDMTAVHGVKSYCSAEGIDCLYYLANAEDSTSGAVAQAGGFQFVDIRMTLERSAGDYPIRETPGVRPFQPPDLTTLQAIARTSHRDSRFYADPHFSRPACDHLYEVWIGRSCAGWAQSVLVAESNGAPVGYITCHLNTASAGSIGLVAVHREFHGKGIGRQLVDASFEFFRRSGAAHVSVVTQGRNIASQRLYQRCGFLTKAVQVWYHRWSPF